MKVGDLVKSAKGNLAIITEMSRFPHVETIGDGTLIEVMWISTGKIVGGYVPFRFRVISPA